MRMNTERNFIRRGGKPDFEYIELYEHSTVLKAHVNTTAVSLIQMACQKILEIRNRYEGVEVCLPNVDLAVIDIIRGYFDISDFCDCEWGDYALLSNERLRPLNIPDKVELSLASLKQIEETKSLDNGEWEFLPGRLDALRQSEILPGFHDPA